MAEASSSTTGLFDRPIDQAHGFLQQQGVAGYRSQQLVDWLFNKYVLDPTQWTNIAAGQRQSLFELVSCGASIESVVASADGATRKYGIRLNDGNVVESVAMPSTQGHTTVCLSSQVGCAMGCKFCRTATMSLVRQLRPSEILWQWLLVAADLGRRPDRIVMMGMGEPLHNTENLSVALNWLIDPTAGGLSPRRITVSTVGLLEPLEQLLEATQVNVAISVNASTSEQRRQWMPIERKYDIDAVMRLLRRYSGGRRKVTAEYVLLAGDNDGVDDARRLVKLIGGADVRVNLIPFNPYEGAQYQRPSRKVVDQFQQVLSDAGVRCFVRWSKGDDVLAACGQLATKSMEKAA